MPLFISLQCKFTLQINVNIEFENVYIEFSDMHG